MKHDWIFEGVSAINVNDSKILPLEGKISEKMPDPPPEKKVDKFKQEETKRLESDKFIQKVLPDYRGNDIVPAFYR